MGYFFLWEEKNNSSAGGRYDTFPSFGALKNSALRVFSCAEGGDEAGQISRLDYAQVGSQ